MPDYRIHYLDADGLIGLAEWIQATNDEEALGKARAMRPDAHKCEVWLGQRLIAKLHPDGNLERIAP